MCEAATLLPFAPRVGTFLATALLCRVPPLYWDTMFSLTAVLIISILPQGTRADDPARGLV